MRLASLLVSLSLAAVLPARPADAVPPQSFRVNLLKQIDVHNGVNDCWGYRAPNGTEIAIYGHQTGTSFVNATDPANAALIATIPGPTSGWRDMFTYSHYCYIVTEAGGTGTGLQIVDLADPLAPVLVTTYTANGFTSSHNIFIDVEEGIAYAVGAAPAGGMRILDLSNPVSPVQLDYFTPYYIHDIYVADGVGYAGAISSGTLRILDLSDPSDPVTIATHSYPNAATHNAWPNAALTHCATTDEIGGGHLRVWDITNLDDIDLASTFAAPGVVHDVRIRDDVAYLSYYTAGARIVDLWDPLEPVEIGYYDTSTENGGYEGDWGVFPFREGNVFYASDRQEGLFILEFTGQRAGRMQGVVRDASTSSPLPNATFQILETGLTFANAADGSYARALPGGLATVRVEAFGYAVSENDVTIPEFGNLTYDVNLSPLPEGTARIVFREPGSGNPIPGVAVRVLETPFPRFSSDANGEVLVSELPAGPLWTIEAGKFGRAAQVLDIAVPENGQSEYFVELARGFADDVEIDQAWTFGAPGDDATDGFWERKVPFGSYYLGIVGPNEDASVAGEGWAFVTESHTTGWVGTSDVDAGKTTLSTPLFDGSGLGSLTLSYQRWFSNRAPVQSADEFRADVSTDGGSTWTNLETVDFGTDSWSAVVVPLPGASASMQLRFVAEDLGEDTFVEAGIDDVLITSPATAAPPVLVPSPPSTLSLGIPSPNPLQRSTTIELQLPQAGAASLDVYDVTGRRVARLLGGERIASGTHRVQWEGRDDDGNRVVPGVYLIRLSTPAGEATRKIAVVR
jgi:choice-of-anchor B domain-containing protein